MQQRKRSIKMAGLIVEILDTPIPRALFTSKIDVRKILCTPSPDADPKSDVTQSRISSSAVARTSVFFHPAFLTLVWVS